MNDLFEAANKIPKWRIVFWGTLGIGAAAWIAYLRGRPGVFWAGLIVIPILVALMLGIFRFGRSPWARRNLQLIMVIYLILQALQLIWRLADKK